MFYLVGVLDEVVLKCQAGFELIPHDINNLAG